MLATGNVPVTYMTLPGGWAGTDGTVAKMQEMTTGKWGSRSPKIRALAINIVRAAKVPEKNYMGEMVAIHNWVRDNIRYTKDVNGQETLCYPEDTAFNTKAGDCLVGETRLLTPMGYKAIKDVKPGDIVQGRNGWTKVVSWWDKGILPVKVYELDNGGEFVATDDHKCILLSGVEVRAADLVEGAPLCGPSAIVPGGGDSPFTEQDCFFVGVFLADGWIDGNRACIAGKDGFAKEQQKRWVADYAAGKGWVTSWHSRYIRVYIPEADPLYDLVYRSETAEGKEVPVEIMACLDRAKAKRLLDGLLSDSHHPMETKRDLDAVEHRSPASVRRSGLCYSTISDELAKQVRLLFRYQGVSVRDTLVVDHGGLGTHPVHRIYPRFFRPKPARVEAIEDAGEQHVYDIETEDHGIYLPDADVVVHNCDDKSLLEAALLGAIGHSSRFVTIGLTPFKYDHVYLQSKPKDKWIALDPIMTDKPAGWEVPNRAVQVRKVFPENIPTEMAMSGLNGPLDWYVGYQGGGFTHSHLSPSPQPGRAGPAAPYVVMDSMLDDDRSVEELSRNPIAFPQNDITAEQMKPRLGQLRPRLINKTLSPAQVQANIARDNGAAQYAEDGGFNPRMGMNGLMGPEELADLAEGNGIDRQMPYPNMQRPMLAQAPEGIDSMFTRPNMVLRTDKGDAIVYKGLYSLAERPPIRPYNGMAGTSGALPGMGGGRSGALPGMGMMPARSISGPGVSELADLADGAVATTVAPAPASNMPKLLTFAALAVGAYLYFKRK